MTDDRFQMLYCDSASCRVNTFERGGGDDSGDWSDYFAGKCPGCGRPGEVVTR